MGGLTSVFTYIYVTTAKYKAAFGLKLNLNIGMSLVIGNTHTHFQKDTLMLKKIQSQKVKNISNSRNVQKQM